MDRMERRKPTRSVRIGSISIGGGEPIAVQSMCATKTQDVEATTAQAEALRQAGAAVVRVRGGQRQGCRSPRGNPRTDRGQISL